MCRFVSRRIFGGKRRHRVLQRTCCCNKRRFRHSAFDQFRRDGQHHTSGNKNAPDAGAFRAYAESPLYLVLDDDVPLVPEPEDDDGELELLLSPPVRLLPLDPVLLPLNPLLLPDDPAP